MKAARVHAYGGLVQIDEIAKPVAGPGQVLVAVKAAAVNPVDWKIASGGMQGWMKHEMPLTLGCEVAGVVEGTGERVFGYLSLMRNGGYAEYAVAEASELAPIPAGLSFAHACAIPVALTTALDGIDTHGGVQAGQRLLVLGGAGGVGMFAIQVAKMRGAFVYASASARNQDRLRELGADVALDYGSADLAKDAPAVDVIFDAVGGAAAQAAVPALKPGGRFVSPAMAQVTGVDLRTYGIQPSGARLAAFPVTSLKIFVDREYPLTAAAEALAYSQTGRARGKIVLVP